MFSQIVLISLANKPSFVIWEKFQVDLSGDVKMWFNINFPTDNFAIPSMTNLPPHRRNKSKLLLFEKKRRIKIFDYMNMNFFLGHKHKQLD